MNCMVVCYNEEYMEEQVMFKSLEEAKGFASGYNNGAGKYAGCASTYVLPGDEEIMIEEEHGEDIAECFAKLKKVEQKHILIQDDDCHWYVIPHNKSDDFDKWIQDEEDWDTPKYAEEVGGCTSLVTFKEYEIE